MRMGIRIAADKTVVGLPSPQGALESANSHRLRTTRDGNRATAATSPGAAAGVATASGSF